jgi:hypothetical protein
MELTLAQILALAALLTLMVGGAAAGHRRGPGRQLAGPLAGLLAMVVGWLAGPALGHAVLGMVGIPWIFRSAGGMLLAFLLAWLLTLMVLWRAGKPTASSGEPDNPVLGAIMGCWTGVFSWLAVLIAWASVDAWRRELAGAGELQELKRSGTIAEVAALPALGWLGELPAWPDSAVRVVRMSREVMADPAKTRRLMADPRVRALASHPSFYPAWGDPEVKQLAQRGSYWALLQHPKVRPLLEDEGFQRELAAVDLEDLMSKSLKSE